jgi:ELWxxDGT repeat protein
MASATLKRIFTEAFRRAGPRPKYRLRLDALEARLAPAAQLVTDINTTPSPYGSYARDFVKFNGETYFSDYDVVHGRELWRTNGTTAGTVMVKDVYPGSFGGYPYDLTAVGGELFFATQSYPNYRYQLWKTDGTEAGTVMVKDFTDSAYENYFNSIAEANGTLYFTLYGPQGNELWKSDGTDAGTVVVKDINPGSLGSYPNNLTAFNGEVYFTADDGTHGYELWKSDGTDTGTTIVADINPSGGSNPQHLTVSNGKLYFAATGSATQGSELWSTDGTAGGTHLVSDINPAASVGSYPHFLTDANGTLFFVADDGSHGYELWKSDAGGTSLVKDIATGSSSYPYALTNLNGTLYFAANDHVVGAELWKSDGTDAGTVLVKDIQSDNGALDPGSSPRYLVVVNGELYFAATDPGNEFGLWKSDGTDAGTKLVDMINPSGSLDSVPSYLFDMYGTLLFRVDDGTHGDELWTSDGTTAGTNLLKDVVTGTADATPRYLTDVNGELYFTADDGVHGRELWKSDGTAAGTAMVKDINTGSYSGFVFEPVNVNGTLYFRANDGTNGWELWKTDGTDAGTVMVKDINPGSASSYPDRLVNFNGELMFVASDGTHGYELWSSDGTDAGTVMVADINPNSTSSYIDDITVVNGIAYFRANDGINGEELWRTDGTTAGTYLLKDINPGIYASDPSYLVEVGGALYFSARDTADGRELWKSDGTPAGTVMVSDIVPGANSSYPSRLVNVNGTVYFEAYDPTHGTELWKSDGTDVGTVLVADIASGSASSFATPNIAIGGTLYLVANDGTGYELWKSDANGTVLVKDIATGPNGSTPYDLTVFNGKLYFTAYSETSGRELWVSDGTDAGTHLAAQIVPGTGDGSQQDLVVSGGNLFFSADTIALGTELWSFDGVPDTTPPSVTVEEAIGTNEPVEAGPIRFDVVFSEPVTGFDQTDVDLSGSDVPGHLSATVTETGPMDGTTFEIDVTGMTSDEAVVAKLNPGAAQDLAGNPSDASTSNDNRVQFAVPPTVTINQDPNQADPALAEPIVFNVVFSEPVTGFDGSKVDLSQSTVTGATAAVTEVGPMDGTTYRVDITGMAGAGQVIARILAGQVTDTVGAGNLASTSTDNKVDFYGGGTISFDAAILDTVAEGVTYTVKVHRTGSQGDVTADFSISPGTASASDFVDNNVTHTLHWADGDSSDKTFTIQIVDDSISEGFESINVGLGNVVGAVGGITAATVGIDYSDPLGSGGSFVESDGDKVSGKLSPAATGTLQWCLTNGVGPISRIVVSGTSSSKSVVSLSVKKAAGGNGTTDVQEVIGSGLKTLSMAKANLVGTGIHLTGPLGSLTVGNVSGGADILAAGGPTLKSSIKAGAIGDGSTINVGSNLTSFTAASVADSTILAPSIGSLVVKGNFAGDVTLSGQGVVAGKAALRTFRVLGNVSGSNIDVAGSVSAVTVGSFADSHLYAGYSGTLDGVGTFTPGDTVTLFQTTSKTGTFANSSVAADVVKTVNLWAVNGNNGGNKFGVFADTSIATVRVRSTGQSFHNPTNDGINDFRLKVV